MKINRAGLRKLINETLLEEGIIDFVPRPAQGKSFAGGGEVITPAFGGQKSDQLDHSFLDALHMLRDQIDDMMEEMPNLSRAQKSYLDAMTDMLSDAISDEERIDGIPDEFDDIDDIENYPEDEASTAAFLRSMGSNSRKFGKITDTFDEPTDDED